MGRSDAEFGSEGGAGYVHIFVQKREEPRSKSGSPTPDILSAHQPVFLGATGRTLVGVSQAFQP